LTLPVTLKISALCIDYNLSLKGIVMKRLISLLQYVLEDSGTWCRTSTTRDLKEIKRRVEHEGISFLTISLTNFGKDFEKSLDQGYVDPSLFFGFKRRGVTPLFLGGFLDHVFDRDTGVLLDFSEMQINTVHDVSLLNEKEHLFINSIRAIRQITLMFGKVNYDCSENRTRKAIQNYLVCEEEVKANDATFLGRLPIEKIGGVLEGEPIAVWEFLDDLIREDIEVRVNPQAFLRSYR